MDALSKAPYRARSGGVIAPESTLRWIFAVRLRTPSRATTGDQPIFSKSNDTPIFNARRNHTLEQHSSARPSVAVAYHCAFLWDRRAFQGKQRFGLLLFAVIGT